MAAKEKKEKPADAEGAEAAPKKGGKKKLLLLAVPVLVLGLGAGLWFSGILPSLLGMGPAQATAENAEPPAPPPPQPAFVELPEIVSNLNAPGRRASFVKLRARIEIADGLDAPAVEASMPRLVDLFATYLREVRPEELRGSAGSHRLREELIARATVAMAGNGRPNAPTPRVTDVLFVEILVQ